MRSKLVAFAVVVALAAVTADAQNQIPNWEFDQQVVLTSLWNLWEAGNFTGLTTVEGARLSGRYAMKIDIGGGALDPLLVFRSYLKLEQGKKHYISFMAKADAPRSVSLLLQARSLYNWQVYWSQDIQLTTEPQMFNFEYTHTGATVGGTGVFNNDIDFHFNLAGNGTDVYVDRVWFATEPPPLPDKTILARPDQPVPADRGSDVPADTSLSWSPGVYAKTHNVYLGTSFDDVNKADLPQAVSSGQTEATYQPSAVLEYGKTYYWRVDEVNAAPSNTVFKGDIWSFTVEPYTYPIPGASITATASSQDKATTGPGNTVNSSGLTSDLHSTVSDAMWLSSMTGPTPVWIQYQFDKAYKISEMWVWNHNTEFEPLLGYGLKDVTIEYSLDGTTWTLLKDAQFAQAPAAPGYAHNTTVDCGGIMAQYVRLTAKSNWSVYGIKQFGLSEVRFYYLPVQARAPQPDTGTTSVGLDASLDWRPGRDAASQKVYFGTDKAAVTNGTVTAQTVTSHGFVPGALDFGTTYYWKVDEIGATTYPGSLWNFTTQEFTVVEDFESYTDQTGSLLYEAWIDGLTDGLSGSTVGYLTPVNGTFGETVIVHGGRQSMPLTYDNSKAPYYSQVTRTFDDPQNWTGNGADSLMLYFQGYPALTSVPVTETAGKISVTGAGTDIWGTSDQFTFVYKSLSGDGTIVARVVDKGTGTNVWAKGGVMIRDDLVGGSTFTAMVLSDNKDGTASNGHSLQYRLAANAAAASSDGTPPEVKAPYWVKVQRVGDGLSGFISADGKTWRQIGSTQMITMATPVYIGLCVTSHQAGENRTVQFDNVSTTGNVTGNWQGAVIAGTQYNAPAGMYVTVEDKAGKKKTVAHPDPAAANIATWTAWKIALSNFTGVNLAAVKSLTIGVGEAATPQTGGTGIVFIDDIGFGKQAVVDTTNLAVNGGFESGDTTSWGYWGTGVTADVVTACTGAAVAEGPVEGKYCFHVVVPAPSANFWDFAFNQAPAPTFQKGKKYTLSAFFKVKSGTGKINMKPEHSADPWEGYGEQQVTLTDRWAEYHVTTPVFTADVSPTSLTFHIAFQAQEFWVDNVKFYEGDYVPSN